MQEPVYRVPEERVNVVDDVQTPPAATDILDMPVEESVIVDLSVTTSPALAFVCEPGYVVVFAITDGLIVSKVIVLLVEPTKLLAVSLTQTLNVFVPSDWDVWLTEQVFGDCVNNVIEVFVVPSSNKQDVGFVSVNVRFT